MNEPKPFKAGDIFDMCAVVYHAQPTSQEGAEELHRVRALPTTLMGSKYAKMLFVQGKVLLSRNQLGAAKARLRQAVQILHAVFGFLHVDIADCYRYARV